MTRDERNEILESNDYNWYLVDNSDGTTEIKHASALSSILECGEPMSRYGIATITQCGVAEDY